MIRTAGNHRGQSHSWQADKPFQYITIQTQTEKEKTSHCAPAKSSLFHTLTLHFILPSSPSSTLRLSVSWYTFFFLLLPLQSPAFVFSRWWQIIFCNGLRCWQLKVTWLMSQQQLDYDEISAPPHFTLTSTCIIHFLTPSHSVSHRATFSLLLIHSLSLSGIQVATLAVFNKVTVFTTIH